mmetsp:Transcript_27591/g.55218  ORF Transcript_27591/g.55218 Transcript_27591/m.55218 type:complete len:311 (+) Transcript_27591:501-1433(+)
MDPSSSPCSLSRRPRMKRASLSFPSRRCRVWRILTVASAYRFWVCRTSAQSLRQVVHRGLISRAQRKCVTAPSKSPSCRRSAPRFLSRLTCSTLSSIRRKAPRMYRVPPLTRCPPCRTDPGRKVPCPTSISNTSFPMCSKNVPPPTYSSAGVMASVMARMPLSTCTSVRGCDELYLSSDTEWARSTLSSFTTSGNSCRISGKKESSSRRLNQRSVSGRFFSQSPPSLYLPLWYSFCEMPSASAPATTPALSAALKSGSVVTLMRSKGKLKSPAKSSGGTAPIEYDVMPTDADPPPPPVPVPLPPPPAGAQ